MVQDLSSNVFARDGCDGLPVRVARFFLDESNCAVFAAADV
jgi:hypothetical protein